MRARLLDPPAVEHDDPVGAPHRGEPVRDDQARDAARQVEERVVELGLAPRVELRGGLVEHQHRCAVPHREQRPGEGDALPLAAGQVAAAGQRARQRRVEPGGEVVEQVAEAHPEQLGPDAVVVLAVADRTHRDVLPQRHLIAQVVLERDGEGALPHIGVEGAQIHAVHRHGARAGLVDAGEQLDERRLARAVDADERRRRARRQLQVEPVEHRTAARVAEVDALQADRVAGHHGLRAAWRRLRPRVAARCAPRDRLELEHRLPRAAPVDELHVRLREDHAEPPAQQDRLHRHAHRGHPDVRPGPRDEQQRDDRADQRDDRVREERRPVHPPAPRPHRVEQPAALREEPAVQPVDQPERADLLGGAGARGELADVGHAAAQWLETPHELAPTVEGLGLPEPGDDGHGGPGQRGPRPEGDGQHRDRPQELRVAGRERQPALGGRAGGEHPLLERLVGLAEAVRDVGPLEPGERRLPQGEVGEPLDARGVHPPRDLAGQHELHGREELLHDERRHGEHEPARRAVVQQRLQRQTGADHEDHGRRAGEHVHRERAGHEPGPRVGQQAAELRAGDPAFA